MPSSENPSTTPVLGGGGSGPEPEDEENLGRNLFGHEQEVQLSPGLPKEEGKRAWTREVPAAKPGMKNPE